VRAKQTRYGSDSAAKVVPIVMHGDAAFAGQGIWAETLNLADLQAYTVGGTITSSSNNLIGFTTRPEQEQSSRFASDIAKRQYVPVFHVNGEDPDAVVRVASWPPTIALNLVGDVVVDIIGYRRHGHSEVDIHYHPAARIRTHQESCASLAHLLRAHRRAAHADRRECAQGIRRRANQSARDQKDSAASEVARILSAYRRGRFKPEYEVETGLDLARLAEITDRWSRSGRFSRASQDRQAA